MKIAKVIHPIRKGDSFQKLINRILTVIIAALALFASVSGVFNTSIYGELLLNGTMSDSLVFGSVVQDIITIPSSLLLLILSVHQTRRKNLKVQILISGLIAYLFYGYGLYTIQGQYTSLYFIYLAVFGMTFYILIFNVIYLLREWGSIILPKSVRYSNAIFIGIILLVLVPAWIGRMTPDVIRRNPNEIYGVFVLDLAMVFPALGIIAHGLIRGNSTYYSLAGIALVKTFTLCLSVALGELIKPLYGFPQDFTMIIIFCVLTAASAVLGILYYMKIEYKG